MAHPRRVLVVGLLGALWALAVAGRWPSLALALALGDSVGPYWSAARADFWPPPHAAIYGGALALPHRVVLAGSSSLWQAFAGVFALQALVAPAAGWLVWRVSGRLLPAAVAGVVVALDPGLIDTTTSGAETYFAALWIGVLALATTSTSRWAMVGPLALGMAIANHPLSVCAAPLLILLPRNRWVGGGALLASLSLVPQIMRVAGAESGGGTGGVEAPVQAALAWAMLAGPGVVPVSAGLLGGLVHKRTRPMALATLASLALLLGMGAGIGYLRDHHLRLLTLPAIAGLAALPRWTAALVMLFLRAPDAPVEGSAQTRRPGTLGLESRVTNTIAALPTDRLVVDGAWISGTPAVEPGAVLLDLSLRGHAASRLAPGGLVVLVVTAERGHLAALSTLPPLDEVMRDDRMVVLSGRSDEVALWTAAACAADGLPTPRLGGAWDGLAILHPDLGAAAATEWLDCSE